MKRKQKKQAAALFLLLLLFTGQTLWQSNDPATLSNTDFLRLHVVANSDSAEDQRRKFKVRDAVLKRVQEETASLQEEQGTLTRRQLEARLAACLPDIEQAARQALRDEGCSDGASARLGVRWIPEKSYGSVSFPAGLYRALTVTIGSGEGKNWWCVLFPPLCLIGVNGGGDAAGSAAAEAVDREKYRELLEAASGSEPAKLQLRFKVAELFQ